MKNFMEMLEKGLVVNEELVTQNAEVLEYFKNADHLQVDIMEDGDQSIITLLDYVNADSLVGWDLTEDGEGFRVDRVTSWASGKETTETLFTYKREATARKKALETGIDWDQDFYKEGQA